MSNYNYLSGSSIDTYPSFLYNILEDGCCYMGFMKGSPTNQWGISALVQIEHSVDYISSIAVSGNVTESKFYDNNSILMTNRSVDKKRIYIVKYNITLDPGLTSPYIYEDSIIGELYLCYINNTWATIQGLVKNYYDLMPIANDANTEEYGYYITNWDQNLGIKVRIKHKTYTTIPNYSTKCELFMSPASGSPYEKICENLEKSTNILGETSTTGLLDPNVISDSDIGHILNMGADAVSNKETLMHSTFKIVDLLGNPIIENMLFVDPQPGTDNIYYEVSSYEASQKYLALKYPYIDNEYQIMKFVIGPNIIDSLSVWQEALPFESIIPVADANPPGLDISYLKNSAIHTSFFDVNGFSKITASNLKYVKEVNNTYDMSMYTTAGFEPLTLTLVGEDIDHVGIIRESILATDPITRVIKLYEDHTFVLNDKIFIPYSPKTQGNSGPGLTYTVVAIFIDAIELSIDIFIDEDLEKNAVIESLPTNVNASITLATTTDKDKALSYGFYNVLIEKTVPKTGALSPTDNIYRQLVIAYNPKNASGVICTDDVYNGDSSLCGVNFNPVTWKYDNGLIIYVSNKLPIYRKWATVDEQFKIIL